MVFIFKAEYIHFLAHAFYGRPLHSWIASRRLSQSDSVMCVASVILIELVLRRAPFLLHEMPEQVSRPAVSRDSSGVENLQHAAR